MFEDVSVEEDVVEITFLIDKVAVDVEDVKDVVFHVVR